MIEALREGGRPAAERAPREDAGDAGRAADEALVCAACGHAITSARERIEVHGAHEHRRVNEHGFDFHLGCFARAPGCFEEGAPTLRWTWFPGSAWQVAGCRGCGAHLGWRFSGEADFHGLVLARLRSTG